MPKKKSINENKKINPTSSSSSSSNMFDPTSFFFTNPPPGASGFFSDDDDDQDGLEEAYFSDYYYHGQVDEEESSPYGFDIYDQFDDYSNPFNPEYQDFTRKPSQQLFQAFKQVNLEALAKEGTKSSAFLKLPLGIFLDIISRLPIKPIAVCRCVCKTWLKIVHHPHFTKLHHTKSLQQNHSHVLNGCISLLFHVGKVKNEDRSDILVFEHENDDNFNNGVVVNPRFIPHGIKSKTLEDFETASPVRDFELVGSCNGLLCLSDKTQFDPIYVCNPVIGEYMILPKVNKWSGLDVVSGFGFDEVSDKYKVVRMFCDSSNFKKEHDFGFKMETEVYTLGSGSWRKLGDIPYLLRRNTSPMFVNGAFHWFRVDCRQSSPELIVGFNISREEFQVIPPPPDFSPTCEICELKLGNLGGYLCLFDHSSEDLCDVWVMKDYGVKESWTKYSLSRTVNAFGKQTSGVIFSPVTMMKNGNILLQVNVISLVLVCYDPVSNKFSTPFTKAQILKIGPMFDAIPHMGSFLSLRDIVQPTNGKSGINTGKWYRVMQPISSQDLEFDIEAWELNEKMRRLWFANH